MAVIAMALFLLLLAGFAEELASFMIDDPEVIHLTVVFIYIIVFVQPIMACEFILAGALRGVGDICFPLLATLCGIILGRLVPVWIVVVVGLSVYWIFVVMILDYGIKATLLIRRFRSSQWQDIRFAIVDHLKTTVDSDKKNI